MGYLFVACAVLCNTLLVTILKLSARPGLALPAKLALGGFALLFGVGNAALLSKAMETVEMSRGYPVYAGGTAVLLLILGAWLFEESWSPSKVAGCAVVILGIYLIRR